MEPMGSTKEPTGSLKNLRVPKRTLSWSVRCRHKQIVHMSKKYAEYQQTLFFNAWLVKIQTLLLITYIKLHTVHNVIFDLKNREKHIQFSLSGKSHDTVLRIFDQPQKVR